MKKTLIMAALAFATLHAYALTNINIDSTARDVTFHDSEGTMLTTLADGYVVSFWWSADGETYMPFAMTGFIDASNWYEWSEPEEFYGMFFGRTNSIVPADKSADTYFMLRIFQTDVSGMTYDEDGGIYRVETIGDSYAQEIADLWDAALDLWNSGTGGDIGEWTATVKTNSSGAYAGTVPIWFGWGQNEEVWLMAPIPEPSTYAAIFGILALGFALRRKK